MYHLICCIFLVVNCVQCHPFDCTIATSGIDSTIKVSIMKRISQPQIEDWGMSFLQWLTACRSGHPVPKSHQWWQGEQLDQRLQMFRVSWKLINKSCARIVKHSCKLFETICRDLLFYSWVKVRNREIIAAINLTLDRCDKAWLMLMSLPNKFSFVISGEFTIADIEVYLFLLKFKVLSSLDP